MRLLFCSLRELSRIILIPVGDRLTAKDKRKLGPLDEYMNRASQALSQLVGLRSIIEHEAQQRVEEVEEIIETKLDSTAVSGRMANNYAIAIYFAELVCLY